MLRFSRYVPTRPYNLEVPKETTPMKVLVSLAAISSAMLLSTGAMLLNKTTSTKPAVYDPGEPMITLPAFKDLGPSRTSTVKACEYEVKPYKMLITDEDYLNFEACLIEYT
jgi:hypothetical protein